MSDPELHWPNSAVELTSDVRGGNGEVVAVDGCDGAWNRYGTGRGPTVSGQRISAAPSSVPAHTAVIDPPGKGTPLGAPPTPPTVLKAPLRNRGHRLRRRGAPTRIATSLPFLQVLRRRESFRHAAGTLTHVKNSLGSALGGPLEGVTNPHPPHGSWAHGAAQESNLPSRGLHHRTGFEDQLGHRAHAAPDCLLAAQRLRTRSSPTRRVRPSASKRSRSSWAGRREIPRRSRNRASASCRSLTLVDEPCFASSYDFGANRQAVADWLEPALDPRESERDRVLDCVASGPLRRAPPRGPPPRLPACQLAADAGTGTPCRFGVGLEERKDRVSPGGSRELMAVASPGSSGVAPAPALQPCQHLSPDPFEPPWGELPLSGLLDGIEALSSCSGDSSAVCREFRRRGPARSRAPGRSRPDRPSRGARGGGDPARVGEPDRGRAPSERGPVPEDDAIVSGRDHRLVRAATARTAPRSGRPGLGFRRPVMDVEPVWSPIGSSSSSSTSSR